MEKSFITKILHTPFHKKDPHGSLHQPIYENVAFEFESAEALSDAFQGKTHGHAYTRISNPTVEHFEDRIKEMSGAVGVLAMSSGMAAIATTLVAIASTGDNIITSRHLFGNTLSLFDHTMREWGLETRYADLSKPEEVAGLIDAKTRMVYLETVTNPQLEVIDLEALSKVVRPKNVPLIVDTTMTPPYLFDAKKFGVDVELLSSTKWISGGATSMGGIVIDHGTFDWKKNTKLRPVAFKYGQQTLVNRLRYEVNRNFGACLSPHSAYLQSLGLETLPLRIDASCANVLKVAEFLQSDKRVVSVHYPGLKSSPYYQVAQKLFGGRAGSLLTFDLASTEKCFQFLNKLKVIRRATNLQDNRTLIIHPASTIFVEFSEVQLEEMGVRPTLIRLSVGIEDAKDLIEDIRQAL